MSIRDALVPQLDSVHIATMSSAPLAVITGAFSYIGAAAARSLLQRGFRIHTLTNRRPPPHSDRITSAPLRFDAAYLAQQLRGADVFVNTYWVRLPFQGQTFASAADSCKTLISAASAAAVPRFVHVSVSNASLSSTLGYYREKAVVDEAVRCSGLSYAIVRPTLVVGPNDVLTANIAWFLRQFPVFPVPEGGSYRLQPVTLDDTGRIIADAALAREDQDIDAAGPVTWTFREYVQLLSRACRANAWIVGTPSWMALGALRMIEPLLGDVILTREELIGLQQELLVSHAPPLGAESVESWLMEHGPHIGKTYVNDVRRHFGDGAADPVSTLR